MRRYLIVLIILPLLCFFSCGVIEHVRDAQQRTRQKDDVRKVDIEFDDKESQVQVIEKVRAPKHDKKNAHLYQMYEKKWQISLQGNENILLLKEIDSWLGTPYRYGGTTKAGADCSGVTIAIYKSVYNIDLSRSSHDIWKQSQSVLQKNLKDGDLVFFKIDYKNISHVGIYISNGNFIHSSTSKGVILNNLEEDYYKKRFYTGGRIKQ
jgi:hypothetical protein